MAITVNHSTPADDSFSAAGASAWNANHSLVGVGTMAEQNANNVAITGGTMSGVAITGYVPTSRLISTGTGLTGGGDLSADRTIAFADANVGTWAGTPSSANLYAAMTTKTGTGLLVFGTNPTLANPNIDVIDFDTTYATPLTAGQLGWDGNNTLAIGMAGGNVTQHIGEDLYFYFKATSAVTKGQVVMFTGAVGASGVPTGAPATGITDGTYIMGIAAESVALNGFGLVQAFGELKNVNTSTYADGDILWYDPAVTGGLTKTKPVAPNIKVQMAAVINGGSSGGGTISIRIDPGSQLGGTDSNVQITSVANGNLLTYDGGNGYWKNTDLAAGTGISISKSANGVLTIVNTSPSSGGTVTSVTGTAPVVSSGGNTPAISMPKATSSVDGYLSATDWTTFNNKTSNTGTVTSVGGTGSVSGLTLSGTVTTSGNLTLGGSLDLSSPPTIGSVTPNDITGATITGAKFVGVYGGAF